MGKCRSPEAKSGTRREASCAPRIALRFLRATVLQLAVGVIGRALWDAIEELKPGNDLGDVDLAVYVSCEDRVRSRVGRDSFDPIIGFLPRHASVPRQVSLSPNFFPALTLPPSPPLPS